MEIDRYCLNEDYPPVCLRDCEKWAIQIIKIRKLFLPSWRINIIDCKTLPEDYYNIVDP